MSQTRTRIPTPTDGLIAEHREIASLLHEIDGLPAEDRERRLAIVHRVERRLLSHFTLEEEVLFPAIWKTGREHALERIDEARWAHRILRQILSELVATDPWSDRFLSLARLLREDVEEYSRVEEENLFPELRFIGSGMLRLLHDRLEERREQLGQG